MAVKQRRVKTTTHETVEDYSESSSADSAPTGGASTPTLGQVKQSETPLAAPASSSDDDGRQRRTSEAPGSSAEQFEAGLKAWFGHHTFRILSVLLTAVVGVGTVLWLAATRLAALEEAVKRVDATTVELRTEGRTTTERLIRLESRPAPAPEPTTAHPVQDERRR